ncbi:MAG: chorismate synthase [Nitrospinae bacterium]|nr:chorismate synthase [Nitrospinota bacterium]MBI3812900.1 chorismate synthase [Nitrospinota bacterium]
MSGNSFGRLFRITTWGESHGPALGVVIDGCPAMLDLREEDIQVELDRRMPGNSEASSPRKEADRVEILSGVFEGKTTGAPISLLIRNMDADSSKYEKIKDVFRPGHADYTYLAKYGIRDYRGGGRSSGRETAGRVAAGAVAKKILRIKGIKITGYTKQIGDILAVDMDFEEIEKNDVRCPDKNAAQRMLDKIREVKKSGDSVGGVVEIMASGVPAGLGEPVFDKLDADIAKALMSIGAVKGVEIGAGFESASLLGSQNNDEIYIKNGKAVFRTNNAGGILGGISNGDDIVARIAVKPTASIAKMQRSVDIHGKETDIKVEGRHDPCICPRIVPVAEAMMAITIADHLLRSISISFFTPSRLMDLSGKV